MLPMMNNQYMNTGERYCSYLTTEWHGGVMVNPIPAYHGSVQNTRTVQIARCEYCRLKQEVHEALSCIACGAPLP